LRVWGRRFEVLEKVERLGLSDFSGNGVAEVVEGADLVILALPIQHMLSTVAEFPVFETQTVVTDVGSTKASVVAELAGPIRDKGGIFVGSHPMAGSEKSGLQYAEPDLFVDAAVVVTPEESDLESETTRRVAKFWEMLGGKVRVLDPAHHDRVVGAVSHLPHLLSAALVRSALRDRDPVYGELTGSGFRDSTRIAAGDPDMWTEIMRDNREALLGEVDRLMGELGSWKEVLEKLDKEELRSFLSEAKDLRDTV
jgi:prephenate dehydrogenase